MEKIIERAEISTLLDHRMPAGPEGIVYAVYGDGTRELLFEFDALDYSCGELPFTEDDFRGLTAEEARASYAPWAFMPMKGYGGRTGPETGLVYGNRGHDEEEIPF